MKLEPTMRFSSRVDDYVKYRPGYPSEITMLLKEECGFTPGSVVADMGSGTGLLAELFLREGCRVYAVEPNTEMREAGEKYLAKYPLFESIDATAEHSTLPNSSVDFITAGQAFHWFDGRMARVEFQRILRPGGWVALVWNTRLSSGSPFLAAYNRLLDKFASEYREVHHTRLDKEDLGVLFGPEGYRERKFPNHQQFDFEGLRGRLLSSSYMPQMGHPNYEPMLAELRGIFDKYQSNGHVDFFYETEVFYGHLS